MDDGFIGKYLVETILGVFVSVLSYFYKRDKANMDREMAQLRKQVDGNTEAINNRLVKKEDFVELRTTIKDEFKYFRERLDEIADRK